MISQSFPNPKNKHQRYNPPPYSANNNKHTPPSTLVLPSSGTTYGHVRDMQKVRERADKVKISISEWIRRDNIVVQMAKDCAFAVGDTFFPNNMEWFNKHGKCVVEGKVISYVEIDLTDTWPSNDEPYIISARSLKLEKNNKFVCAPSFMSKKEPVNV